MPSFKELLSGTAIAETFASTVSVGDVYRMRFYPKDGITPKNPGDTSRNKMFVVLGKDEEHVYGCVLINTDVNVNALSQEAQRCQFPIMKHKYDGAFTAYVSHVDCSKLRPVSIDRLSSCATRICQLLDEDLEYIFDSVRNNGQISLADLRRYGIVPSA